MSISLTNQAILAVRSALNERGHGIGIRLQVSIGGPSGLSFRLEFADTMEETDLCFTQDGVRVLTDMRNLVYTEGLVLDYGRLGDEEGFSVHHAQPCNDCDCVNN